MHNQTKVAPGQAILHSERLLPAHTHRRRSSHEVQIGSRASLVTIILRGTLIVSGLMLLLLCLSYALGNTYVFPRIVACLFGLAYLAVVGGMVAKSKLSAAAWMLVGFYAFLALSILWLWSINAQIGILMLGFVIVLASTLLGARYIIPVTIGAVVALAALQLANSLGVITPDTTSLSKESTFADVLSYGIIFIILALISWLSRRQMERTLHRAQAAEKALEQEKESLASRLAEQTQHLREIQLEEMQQLYRFAEIGQQSTAVLHDLANHLTVLTLDIDDIQQRTHQSDAITNAKESISYLDTMVTQVRRQIQDDIEPQEFNVITTLEDIIMTLQPKAIKTNVTITLTKTGEKKDFIVMGDPLRLSQVITILVTNAVDAYKAMEHHAEKQTVEIDATIHASKILLSITDYGIGISDFQRAQLFEPFQSTKEKGLGIGLFIAKKMIETHFKGDIRIDPRHDATEFAIKLPRHKHNSHQK